MKTASAALQSHFGQDSMTLAVLWKVTRADATIMGFTTHDQDIVYGGVTYAASTGMANTATQSGSDLSVDNLEVTAFLDSSAIDETDILAGVYDNCQVEERVVNWDDLTMGDMLIRKGYVGNIKIINGVFTAELRGLTQKLTTKLGSTYGPICRAILGSNVGDGQPGSDQWPCGISLASYQQSGSVASSPDARTIVPAAGLTGAAGYFDGGLINFTSGVLNGKSYEIKSWDGTSLKMYLPLPAQPAASDTFTITPGCNHTTSDCISKFSNIINFKGEPFIPGNDLIMNYPNATT